MRSIAKYLTENLIKFKAYHKSLIMFVSVEFVIYFIIIDMILVDLNLDKQLFSFIENILFNFMLACFLFFYLIILKYKINYDKLFEVLPNIKFEGSRTGTDGLCCFLSKKVKEIPFPREKENLLVRLSFTQEPLPNDTLRDVIENYDVDIMNTYERCSQVKLDYKISNNNLIFDFGCKIYDKRPQACRDYPYPETGIPCRLGQNCCSPKQQVRYMKWSYLFLYAFEKKKYPELKKFSVGELYNMFYKYYLIPVPFNDKEFSDIYCQ